jgi:hypothetical protein
MYVFGPNGFQRPVKASKLAAGSFRVRLPIGKQQGCSAQAAGRLRAFPRSACRQEEEMTDYGSNDFVLKQISAATGVGSTQPEGRVRSARGIFRRRWSLPGLLALAVLLNLWTGNAKGQEPVRK